MRISDWSSDVCSSDLLQCWFILIASRPLKLGANSPLIAALHHRSEEHTSELQSLMRSSYAVFCLNKKNNQNNTYTYICRKSIKYEKIINNVKTHYTDQESTTLSNIRQRQYTIN